MSQAEEISERMHRFAVRIVKFCKKLPATPEGYVVRQQLARAGTGTPANYRAAHRARSHAEFTAKIGVASEEADETVFWLRLAIDSQLAAGTEVDELHAEAKALWAICAAAYRTARATRRRREAQRDVGM